MKKIIKNFSLVALFLGIVPGIVFSNQNVARFAKRDVETRFFEGSFGFSLEKIERLPGACFGCEGPCEVQCVQKNSQACAHDSKIGKDHAGTLCYRLITPYGTTIIDEPVLIELIESPAFERLKGLRQYSVIYYAQKEPEFTRYWHCLGVFFITRRYGAPLEEQVAALLHDASHAVFSHVADYLFKTISSGTVYQDTIHEVYLAQAGVIDILKKYGFEEVCGDEAKKTQRCLEQEKPDLCADRIDYVLQGGIMDNYFSYDDVAQILSHLHYQYEKWFFDDLEIAKKYAVVSLKLPANRWGAPWHVYLYDCVGNALRYALQDGIIAPAEVRFLTDDIVWKKLLDAQLHHEKIRLCLHRFFHWKQAFSLVQEGEGGTYMKGKFTGTDPLVKVDTGLVRISQIDTNFKNYYDIIRTRVNKGCWVKELIC